MSCSFWISSTPCGPHDGSDYLFHANQLQSCINDIDGIPISDYILIMSRTSTFHYKAAVCSRHRYVLCEGYVPPQICALCYGTRELVQMSVRASLFIGKTTRVPILGYICKRCRPSYEEQMEIENCEHFLTHRNGFASILNCFARRPPIIQDTGATFLETSTSSTQNTSIHANNTADTNRSVIIVTQHTHSDRSSSCKSENETSRSTASSAGLSNSSPVEDDIKTSKLQLTLRTQQNGSLEQDTHSNQQHIHPDASMLQNGVHVIQETETNAGSQRRRSTRGSSSTRVSHIEPMDVQRFIQIKICASPLTTHQYKTIRMSETDTLAMLKAEFIKTLKPDNYPNDFSLSYLTSDPKDTYWKTLKIEEENRTLAEMMLGDNYIVTFVSEKSMCDAYPLPGLQNLGNTCFMNSALQCLNHVEPFFNYFRGAKIKNLLNGENNGEEITSTLTGLYSQLVESLCSPHDGPVVPVEFYMEFRQLAPRFGNYRQHDSFEFLNVLLDSLHEDLMRILKQSHTIVSETFHGQIQTVVTCQTCKKDLKTDESFNFLPLPIPEKCENSQSSRTRGYKLDQCFDTFLQGEHIGNHGQWYCEYCDKLTDANKKLYLLELPRVLIIQLKRFNYDLQSYAKIETPVEYDLDNFDINDYVIQSHRDTRIRYNLVAVSNHWGTLISGHYMTYTKLPGTQDWYKYNDDRVCKVDKDIHVNNYSAYILVYQQEENDYNIGTAV